MKIAVSGKGGVGKTTIAGTLARLLGQSHPGVLALDADSNPNLAYSLGIPRQEGAQVLAVPRGLTEWREDANGKAYVHLRRPVTQFLADYGVAAPDGIRLVVTGQVDHAGAGCRCEAHAVARGITGQVIAEAGVVVLDMEAGLEHLGRGTVEHVDILLIVLEPYFRSLEAASRIRDLAVELEVPRILAVANRVRRPTEQAAIARYCEAHQLQLAATIPFDEAIIAAEEHGLAPVDYAADSPAVQAIRQLAAALPAYLG